MGKNSQKTFIKKSTLGRALYKSRFNKGDASVGSSERWLHTSELEDTSDWSKTKNAKSVTEQNSLDDFLATAELAGTEFESEKLNVHIVVPRENAGVLDKEELKLVKETQEKHKHCLRIPRRPIWKNADYDAPTLQLKERESFLEWRRNLAQLQQNEHLSMTPFEKNLEFWRQLWRVIERSDVIVQIVDARNPLLFYCVDLENYVKEVDSNKLNVLLVNKSDFLSDKQRLEWHRYFKSRNVHAIFWSAALATEMLEVDGITEEDEKSERARTNSHRSDLTEEDYQSGDHEHDEEELSDLEEEDDEEEEEEENKVVNKFNLLADEKSEPDEDEQVNDSSNENETESETENETESEQDEKYEEEKPEAELVNKIPSIPSTPQTASVDNNELITDKLNDLQMTDQERIESRVLNRHELIQFLKTVHKSPDKAKPGLNTIGLVGYPNVGKSSTINALLKGKKTAVSDTPGKTKHYQTLYVDDDLLLCDCPGLVFPSFVSTRGELILNGILPIDQMRDYVEPVNLIPRSTFEMFYGIQIPKPKDGQDPNRRPTAEELCSAYSIYRGYMNHKGTPDVQRGARYILKDYVNGKLLYCYPPQGIEPESFQDHKYEMSKEAKYLLKINKIQQQQKKPQLSNFDQEFFVSAEPRALTKGGIVGYHRNSRNKVVERDTDLNDLMSKSESKPWKKHNNKNKREKLRRKTSHFDQNAY